MNPMRALLSFLTILPMGRQQDYEINYIARYMFLFPAAGAIMGMLVGSLAFGLSFVVHGLFVGLLSTAALFILTGSHHTDALSDFADGLMAKGSKDSKRKVMRDPRAGSAGTAALVMYFAGSVIALSMMSDLLLLRALIVSEVIAKFVMVLQAHRGIAAWEGIGSPFTQQMKSKAKFLAACAITVPIAYILGGLTGLYALGAAIVIALVLLRVANKSFGGVSGDVFGASNEVTRLSSLIVLASII